MKPALRALAVICALIPAGWLALNLRSATLADRASDQLGAAVAAGGRPDDVSRARRLFESSRRFAPDASSTVREAIVLGSAEPSKAAALLDEVVRDEPDNVSAWLASYTLAANTGDVRRRQVARARLLALDPDYAEKIRRFEAGRR